MPLFSKKIVPTEITNSIEKATSPTVTELDYALVFQICEAVNSTELGAKEARKLLQKKMKSNDAKTQVLALEILNSLGENCSGKFGQQLSAKSFGEDLYSLASSKTMDDRVHSKLAQCLTAWNYQYGNDPNFGAIRRAHDILMNGVTPAHRRPTASRGVTGEDGSRAMPREQRRPTDVKGDIELAKNSAQLFSQTLSFTDPTKEDISKNELIQEFYGKCKQSQQLLASHLETCEDSDIISALINTNNELLGCFKSYDEMLEQHAVNEATVNSQTLHDRNSNNGQQIQQQQQQQQQQLLGEDLIPNASSSSSSSSAPIQAPLLNQQVFSNDPFDPFADTNQVQQTDNVNTAGNNPSLPPPILPQRMHNE